MLWTTTPINQLDRLDPTYIGWVPSAHFQVTLIFSHFFAFLHHVFNLKSSDESHMIQLFWKPLVIPHHFNTTKSHSIVNITFSNLPLVQRKLFVTIMWSLWKRRNLKLWQQQNETITQVLERAKHILDDWRSAQHIRLWRKDVPLTHQGNSSDGIVVEWSKPAYGRYRCNIDASFSSSMSMVGTRICLRDDRGEFVSAKTYHFSPLCDVIVGEAVGFHTTLKWTAKLQYDNVDFALDSKIVIDHFLCSLEDGNEFGCIMYACKQLFEINFQNSHVEFNRRQANGIAHELARVAPSHASSHVYDNVRSCISSLIDNEK